MRLRNPNGGLVRLYHSSNIPEEGKPMTEDSDPYETIPLLLLMLAL
jgi:hypothetical protein